MLALHRRQAFDLPWAARPDRWISVELLFYVRRKPRMFRHAWQRNLPAILYMCAMSAASSLPMQLTSKVTSAAPSTLHDWNRPKVRMALLHGADAAVQLV